MSRFGIEFLFGDATKRELFERGDIRTLCEAEVLDFARNWESSNGKFKIDAAIKAFKDEEVTLAWLDLSEINVPLNNLSEKDKAYVNLFKQANQRAVISGQIPAVTPALPELDHFEDGFGGTIAIAVDGSTRAAPLGEVPTLLKEFQQSECGFTMARERQELVAAIPVGGPDQLVLMTAREDNFHNGDQLFQSQAYWVSLKQREVIGSVALSPEHFIVDYDPRHRHLLSGRRGDHTDVSSGPSPWFFSSPPLRRLKLKADHRFLV